MEKRCDVAVIGGGPAGYTAAIFAARRGLRVIILDKNKKRVLHKLRITGKGRCNLTNNCSVSDVCENTLRGSRFMRSPLSTFAPADIMEFFEELGVPLKTERGRRVFPVSDNAQDICDALSREAKRLSIETVFVRALDIRTQDGAVCGVRCSEGTDIICKAAVIATGGLSYPATGSDGDGYTLAKKLGHKVTDTCPSLVSLICSETYLGEMQGLSLKNVTLTCKKEKKVLFSEMGEMLFTNKGISGPLVLSLSAVLAGMETEGLRTYIDLKPALDNETLDKRILKDFSENPNKAFRNSLDALLPRSMVPVMLSLSVIDPDKKVNSVTSKERGRLRDLMKMFPVTITGRGGYNEAVVTAGGVSLKDITPATMMSKLIRNLHFAGEVMDIDAYTGGYNLTIAFSTGHAAGMSVLKGED